MFSVRGLLSKENFNEKSNSHRLILFELFSVAGSI